MSDTVALGNKCTMQDSFVSVAAIFFIVVDMFTQALFI